MSVTFFLLMILQKYTVDLLPSYSGTMTFWYRYIPNFYSSVVARYNTIKNRKRTSQQYLHPWNNLPQNVVQTSSPLWRAQKPVETTQSLSREEMTVLMNTLTLTLATLKSLQQKCLSPCRPCSIYRLVCCIQHRWAPPRTGTAVSGCLQ